MNYRSLSISLLALFLMACEARLPANEIVEAPEGEREAVELSIEVWGELTGLEPIEEPPLIIWFEGSCLEYSDGDCPFGRWRWHEDIHLIYRDTPSKTGLSHEVLHWMLDVEEGDPDSDHTLEIWKELPYVNQQLIDVGL